MWVYGNRGREGSFKITLAKVPSSMGQIHVCTGFSMCLVVHSVKDRQVSGMGDKGTQGGVELDLTQWSRD